MAAPLRRNLGPAGERAGTFWCSGPSVAAGGLACLPARGRCRRWRCGARSGRARNTAPSRSRAHASRRYRRGRSHPCGLRPSARIRAGIWSSPGGMPARRSTVASAPSSAKCRCSIKCQWDPGGAHGGHYPRSVQSRGKSPRSLLNVSLINASPKPIKFLAHSGA
jgi:hypothetical protein